MSESGAKGRREAVVGGVIVPLSAIGFNVKSGTPVLKIVCLDSRGKEILFANTANPISATISGAMSLMRIITYADGGTASRIHEDYDIVIVKIEVTGGSVYVGEGFGLPIEESGVAAGTWLRDADLTPTAGYESWTSGNVYLLGNMVR